MGSPAEPKYLGARGSSLPTTHKHLAANGPGVAFTALGPFLSSAPARKKTLARPRACAWALGDVRSTGCHNARGADSDRTQPPPRYTMAFTRASQDALAHRRRQPATLREKRGVVATHLARVICATLGRPIATLAAWCASVEAQWSFQQLPSVFTRGRRPPQTQEGYVV